MELHRSIQHNILRWNHILAKCRNNHRNYENLRVQPMSTDITPDESVCPIYLEEASAEQIAEIKDEFNQIAKSKSDRAKAKEAVLAKLGLTADEVTALLS